MDKLIRFSTFVVATVLLGICAQNFDSEGEICGTNEDCSNATICECNSGFKCNGSVCIDINECLDEATNSSCNGNKCVNTPGSYFCFCGPGQEGETTCDLCVAGTYKSTEGTDECSDCNAGTYCSIEGATSCSPCPNNTDSQPRSAQLTSCTCNLGYTAEMDGIICTACPAGTYKFLNGNGDCIDCPINTYSPETASQNLSDCLDCDEGSVAPEGSAICDCKPGYLPLLHDDSRCEKCLPGTYKTSIGPANCTLCKAGTYLESEGGSSPGDCQACDYNTYSTALGASSMSSCLQCPSTYSLPDGPGAVTCACDPGFYFDLSKPDDCQDVDECLLSTPVLNNCDCQANCNNTFGSFTCTCSEGYYGVGTVGTCVDVCDAVLDRCDNRSSCVFDELEPALYRCACHVGYALPNASGTICRTPLALLQAASCTYAFTLPDAYSDTPSVTLAVYPDNDAFREQYQRNGTTVCEDVNECLQDLHDCDEHATCTNTAGSFTCACNAGWNGTGVNRSCADINECKLGLSSCDRVHGSCFNTVGSFQCLCVCGYEGNGSYCEDVDECHPPPPANITLPHPNSTASNRTGPALPVRLCAKVVNSTSAAQQVPQTVANNCDPHAVCRNTAGSFVCACGRGYRDTNLTLYRANGTNCTDVNECQLGTDNCDLNATCSNTAGSYTCACNAGFGGNGTSCADVNECANASSPVCATGAACFNTVGSFFCLCGPGYSGNNVSRCVACPAGTYKNASGPYNCSLCSSGKYSSATAARKSSACAQCPNNTDTSPGANMLARCRCNAGFTAAANGLPCFACQPGSYKSATGVAPCANCSAGSYSLVTASIRASDCQPCPVNTSSPSGSADLEECVCNIGHWSDADGVPCAACLSGTYKSTQGASNCTTCAAGKFSSATAAIAESNCLQCTNNSLSAVGSSSAFDCQCNAGFTLLSTLCTACAPGTYKYQSGPVPCQFCTDHASSPPASSSVSNCTCNAGYAESGMNGCYVCGAGKFSNGSGVCFACPPSTTSEAGSQDETDCVCNAGYSGRDGGPCLPCQADTYKLLPGSALCESCPSNSFGVANGSVSAHSCVCNAGYEGSGNTGCTDVDECAPERTSACRDPATCINTEGSYVCSCPVFLVSNGTACHPSTARIEILGKVIAQCPTGLINSSEYGFVLAATLGIPFSDVDFAFAQSFGSSQISDLSVLPWLCSNISQELFFRAFITLNISSRLSYNATDLIALNTALDNERRFYHLLYMEVLQYFDRQNLRCGDRIVSIGETCDDGNTRGGDGCSEYCQVETGWKCVYINGNGSICSEINECQYHSDCSQFARCINTVGSFLCSCLYNTLDVYGDGTLCEETASSFANNTAFSNLPSVIPGHIKDSFVQVVAIYENNLLISRTGSDFAAIYQRTGNEPWPTVPSTHLYPMEGAACTADGQYGTSAAITLDLAIVGSTKGCVSIYHLDIVSQNWSAVPVVVLTRDDLFYGTAVAAFESTVLVGAYGAAKVFLYVRRNNYSWSTDPTMIFAAQDHSFFGHQISLTSDQVFVSVRGQGTVLIFVQNQTGFWPSLATFTLEVPYSTGAAALFGPSLSATEKYAFIGDPAQRSVFVFSRLSDGSWPSSPTKLLSNHEDMFGSCIAITDVFALISAYESNTVYIYRVAADGSWIDPAIQRISEKAVRARFLGHSCALTNFDVVLGSYQDANTYIHSAGCAVNAYGLGIENCTQCPIYTISPYLSKYITDCSCQPGFYGPNGGPCEMCPIKSYCTGGTDKTACPNGTKSAEKSYQISDCKYASFIVKSAQQSSNFPNVQNNITFTLMANVDLDPAEDGAVNITIDSLTCFGSTGCQQCSSTDEIFCIYPPGECPLLPVGFKGGYLVLSLIGTLEVGVEYKFSICVQNPAAGQYSPDIGVMATFGNNKIYIPRQLMDKASGSEETLAILGFGAALIKQSTPSQLVFNSLYVDIKLTSTMQMGSNLTLSGLSGSKTTNSSILITNTGFPSTVSSLGYWNHEENSLVVTLSSDVQGNVLLSFSFSLVNGNKSQDAPTIFSSGTAVSSGTSDLINIGSFVMNTTKNNEAAMLIAGFKKASMFQNSTVPSAQNSLTVSLQSRVTLTTGMFVAVSGLRKSQTSSTLLTIAFDSVALDTLSQEGSWEQETGTLSIAVLQDIPAGHTFALSFVLLNPEAGQDSPRIFAQILGLISSSDDVQARQNESDPFLVAGFRIKSISQASPWPGCKNTLFITINMFVPLPYSASGEISFIRISGLVGISDSNLDLQAFNYNRTEWWNNISFENPKGTVTFDLRKGILMGSDINYYVELNVTNSIRGQQAPLINIYAAGPGWSSYELTMKPVPMDQGSGDSAALVIAGIRSSVVFQSSVVSDANNTISVVFSLFSDLPKGSGITISGFTDSNSRDQDELLIETEPELFASYGTWNRTTGSVVLNTTTVIRSDIGNHKITFQILNPSAVQDSAIINMTIKCIYFCDSVSYNLQNGPGNSAPFLVAGFKLARISQSNATTNAENIISLALMPAADLLFGSLLNLQGLTCLRCSCFECCIMRLVNVTANGVMIDVSMWTFSDTNSQVSSYPLSALSISLGDTMKANIYYEIEFKAINPGCLGKGASKNSVMISVNPPSTALGPENAKIYPFPLELGVGAFNPFLVSFFLQSEISQSSTASLALNNMTVNFSINCPLSSGSYLSVWGLTNSNTESGNINLVDDNASIFESASWNRETGELTLKLGSQGIQSGLVYAFTFQLRNPIKSQQSPPVSIEAFDPVARTKAKMTGGNGLAAPFLIIEFIKSSIAQSTMAAGKVNTISITFAVSLSIGVGSEILISGLTGTQTQDQTLSITWLGLAQSTSSIPFAKSGAWTQSSGTFTIFVETAEGLSANNDYAFSFNVTNPLSAQKAVSVSIAVSGSASIAWTTMLSAAGEHSPLLVSTAFSEKTAWQSTPSAFQSNTIVVTLSTENGISFTGFEEGVLISFAGLTGTATQAGPRSVHIELTQMLNSQILVGSKVLAITDSGSWIPATVIENLQDSYRIKWDSSYACFNASYDHSSNDRNYSHQCSVCTSECFFCSTCVWNSSSAGDIRNCSLGQIKQLTENSTAVCITPISETYVAQGYWGSDGTFNFTLVATSSLTLVVNSFVIQFQVVNSFKPQDSPDISISIPDLGLDWVTLDKAKDIHAPLVTAGFISANISQSNPSQSARNSITSNFFTQTNLPIGCQIIISGLFGVTIPAESLVLTKGSEFFNGHWLQENSSILLIAATNNISALTSLSVSFTVVNPSKGQLPPSIIIEGQGIIRMASFVMSTPKNNNAALLVAELTTSFINQSTVFISALNTYTVILVSNVLIPSGSTLQIEGLIGTRTQQQTTAPDAPQTVFSGGVLELTWSNALLPDVPYIFSFNLFNKDSMLQSTPLTIGISKGPITFMQLMHSGLGNSAPCTVAGFYNKSIWQESPGQGSSNTIHVEFSSNVDIFMSSSWSLKISNLNNLKSSFVSGVSFVLISYSNRSYKIFADFDQNTNSIAILLNQENILSKTIVKFSFSILNPKFPQDSTETFIQLLSGENQISNSILMDGGTLNSAPMFVIGFETKVISQSSVSALTNNNITIIFAVSGLIDENASITITGLDGFESYSGNLQVLPWMSNQSLIFAKYGSWNRTAGRFTVLTTSAIDRSIMYGFVFTLLNPKKQISKSLPFIEIDIPRLLPVPIDSAQGNSAPLLIAGFVVKTIGQSTPAASTLNIISITLSCTASLYGSNITISGLVGSDTADDDHLAINSTDSVMGPTGQWNRTEGSLILTIESTMQADKSYIVSFTIMNPRDGQPSPSISIETSGLILVSKSLMDSASGNSAPLLVAGFVLSTVSQSTPIPNASNTITISIKPNVIIKSWVNYITVHGLIATQTKSSNKFPIYVLRETALSTCFGSYAQWFQQNGSLILQVQSIIYPQFTYEVAFEIKNPSLSQDPPTISISCGGFMVISSSLMLSMPGNSMPLLIAGFIVKSIGQSTTLNTIMNTITVTLSNRATLPEGSYILLSGLNGGQNSAANIHITDKNVSSCFFNRAKWDQSTFTLTLTIIKDMERRTIHEFSFNLLNPSYGQDSPSVSLKVSGALDTGWEKADSALGNMAPLLTSGFDVCEIAQTNPSATVYNTLNVKLKMRVSLYPPIMILISNLIGAASPRNNTLFVRGNLSTYNEHWDPLVQTLSFNISNQTDPLSVYVLSFEVLNPDTPQQSPQIFVEIKGVVQVPRTPMQSAQGNSAPLLIAGFVVKTIGQSTPAASTLNTISITLSCTASLYGSNITISGLVGSDTADDDHLAINSTDSVMGPTGQWNRAEGSLILTIESTMQADKSYIVSFTIMNPQGGQPSPSISIETSGLILVSKRLMDSASGNSAPLLVAGFLIANISQLTPSAGANNTLTAFVSFNVMITQQMEPQFTISGLTGSLTKSTSSLLLLPDSSSAFASVASWYQSGSLVFELYSSILPSQVYSLSFVLINPIMHQDSINISISASGIKISKSNMLKDLRYKRSPFDVAYFTEVNIGQSTTIAGANNTITLTMATSVALGPGFAITLSGLLASMTNSTEKLRILENVNETQMVFSPFGTWTQSSGELIISIITHTIPELLYICKFQLRNPQNGQDAPVVSIEVYGDISIGKSAINFADGNNAPFLVSDIVLRRIGQSTCSAGQSNVIAITFGFNVLLPQLSILTFYGFTGLNESLISGIVPIQGNFSSYVDQRAYWNADQQLITLNVTKQTDPLSVYVLSFEVLNPDTPQQSPQIFVEIKGVVQVPRTPMQSAQGNSAPLLIAGFVVKTIGQSTPAASTLNTISITLSCTASLYGSNITISGLVGSDTADDDHLAINSTNSVMGPTGQWNQSTGTLIMEIKKLIVADSMYIVRFHLANPNAAQSPATVFVEVVNKKISISKVQLLNGDSLQAPLLVATQLKECLIGQATPNPGVMNLISATLVASDTLYVGTQITISGLIENGSPNSLSVNVTSRTNSKWSAIWYHSSGTIIFRNEEIVPADLQFVLSFNVLNPLKGQDAPTLTVEGSGVWIVPRAIVPNNTMYSPLLIADFLIAEIEQSDPFMNKHNILSVYFAARLSLKNSLIILSGISKYHRLLSVQLCLNQSQLCTDCNNVSESLSEGTEPLPSCIRESEDANKGTLTFSISQSIKEATVYKFLITFLNPAMELNSSSVYIQCSGVITIPRTFLNPGTCNKAPFLVGGWIQDRLEIWQSTDAAGAINTINIAIACQTCFAVKDNVNITIAGLSGSQTPSGILPILGSSVYGSTVLWIRDLRGGSLVLQVQSDTDAGISYHLSVDMLNPYESRDGTSNITVEARSGSEVLISPLLMNVGLGNALPFLIAGFSQVPYILFHVDGVSINSSLTLHFSSTTRLAGYFGTKITVSGLLNSSTKGTDAKLSLSSASNFGTYCRWFQKSGKLVLTVMREAVPALTPFDLMFELGNVEHFVKYLLWKQVFIEATYITFNEIGLMIAKVPVFSPGFASAYFGVNESAITSDSVTVTVTLAFNLDIQVPLKISVLGLCKYPPKTYINISLGKEIEALATWSSDALVFTTKRLFISYAQVLFSFELEKELLVTNQKNFSVFASCRQCDLLFKYSASLVNGTREIDIVPPDL